jgi:uncharacterized protein YlaI
MLVKIPPSISASSFVGDLKGKSILMIFERNAKLKYKYGNRHFWCRGYNVDTVDKNAKKITECIQIFHKSNIYICDAYHELLDIDELIDEEIKYNPDKIITCPECGANYKLKNIQKGAKNSLKQITL